MVKVLPTPHHMKQYIYFSGFSEQSLGISSIPTRSKSSIHQVSVSYLWIKLAQRAVEVQARVGYDLGLT